MTLPALPSSLNHLVLASPVQYQPWVVGILVRLHVLGQAEINYVSDVRHGQGTFCNVCGENDLPAIGRGRVEYFLMLHPGYAGVQGDAMPVKPFSPGHAVLP